MSPKTKKESSKVSQEIEEIIERVSLEIEEIIERVCRKGDSNSRHWL